MLNLFFLLLSYSIIPASSCPDGWQPSKTMDGKCYLFVYQHEAWHQAESYCTKAAIGGHLTSITSAFENAEILGKLSKLVQHFKYPLSGARLIVTINKLLYFQRTL